MKNLIKKLIKKLKGKSCKHVFMAHGWSYIKCKKCTKTKYDPNKNSELLNKYCNKMLDSGAWNKKNKANIMSRGKMFN